MFPSLSSFSLFGGFTRATTERTATEIMPPDPHLSPVLNKLPAIANHFVAAEVKDFDEESKAMAWLE